MNLLVHKLEKFKKEKRETKRNFYGISPSSTPLVVIIATHSNSTLFMEILLMHWTRKKMGREGEEREREAAESYYKALKNVVNKFSFSQNICRSEQICRHFWKTQLSP